MIQRTLDDLYTAVAVTLEQEDVRNARPEERDALVRKKLQRQRTLLILDNLETVDDERLMAFLREPPAPTKFIVTTRHWIEVAYPLRLTGMSWEDALKLIAQECEKRDVTLSDQEAEWLFKRTGGVPLAIVWSVAYACADRPRAAATRFTWPHFNFIVWTTAAERTIFFNDLLDTIAHRLNYPGLTQKPLAEKQERVKDILALQPVLLIVDNFETITDPAIADFLAHLPSSVKVLLTSRETEGLLPPVFRRYPPARIPLDGLPDAEALICLHQAARRLASLRRGEDHAVERARLEAVLAAQEQTLLPLIKATGGNPKALSLALSYIADQALPLPTLVRDLYAAADSVVGLFDYLFSRAWERCTEGARALWRVIPFFAAPARREALKAATGLQGRYFQDAVEELYGRSLMEAEEGSDEEPRYRAHSLVRAFGQRRLDDAPDFEAQARERWADFYLQYVELYGDDDFGEGIGREERERLRDEITTFAWLSNGVSRTDRKRLYDWQREF